MSQRTSSYEISTSHCMPWLSSVDLGLALPKVIHIYMVILNNHHRSAPNKITTWWAILLRALVYALSAARMATINKGVWVSLSE
jgi:hypothetical protein